MEESSGNELLNSFSPKPRPKKYVYIIAIGGVLYSSLPVLIFSILNHLMTGFKIFTLTILIPLPFLIIHYFSYSRHFQRYLIIFERGIKIHRVYLRIIPINNYIPLESISEVEIEKKVHLFHISRKLLIHTNDNKKFVLNKGWKVNYEKVVDLIRNLKNS